VSPKLVVEEAGHSAAPLGRLAPDHQLEQRIRTHFYWSGRLHDQDIEVSVRHGRVTLTGTVDTWMDRRQAAAEAYACGALDVNNHLHLPAPH
jgi:osmotically-inducible protein OsmY